MSKAIKNLVGHDVVIHNLLTNDPKNKQGYRGTVLTVDEKRDEITVKFEDGTIGIYIGIDSFPDVLKCPIYNNGETWDSYNEKSTTGELLDELNPNFLFSTTNAKILSMIISGEIDVKELAKRTLRNSGLDMNGNWIGFNS